MFIINQSGDWAVNSHQIDIIKIKQTPVITQPSKSITSIRVTVGTNEFLLATYADKLTAYDQYTNLLCACVNGGSAAYRMPEDK
jgi:hypothetical protein